MNIKEEREAEAERFSETMSRMCYTSYDTAIAFLHSYHTMGKGLSEENYQALLADLESLRDKHRTGE